MSLPTTVGYRQHLHHTHTPAYNPVPTRTVLIKPPVDECSPSPQKATMPASSPTMQQPRRVDWPDSVRDYVRRSFDPQNAEPSLTEEEVQARLKSILGYYAERNQLNAVDWSTFPYPQTLIMNERKEAERKEAERKEAERKEAERKEAEAQRLRASNGWTNNSTPIYFTPNGTTNSAGVPQPQERKKRKSMDDPPSDRSSESIPPWRKQASNNTLEDRMSFPSKNGEKRRKKGGLATDNLVSKMSEVDLERRRKRFQLGTGTDDARESISSPPPTPGNPIGPVVGTCLQLEKSYLRLTAPPKPETVRPQHVLEKTLEHLKKKWREDNNYAYVCDQFKSLRQDLTVQHIKNKFTVTVYEIHARIALEKGDLGEYNQCQTQLRALYAQKLGGHPSEFLAYRILYYIYTRNHSGMNDLLAELTSTDKAHHAIKHALDVRSSLALGNYHKFFKLYLNPPNMGGYLMDMFVHRERLAALCNISRAYMKVSLRFLWNELAFESGEACAEFLNTQGAQSLIDDSGPEPKVNLKEAKALFENLRMAAFSTVDIKGQI